MFDFFNNEEKPSDVKAIRNELIMFIKDQLRRSEGGEGARIKSIQLFLVPEDDERMAFEAAVSTDAPAQFKNDIQKIADDYAIDLPEAWTMDVYFDTEIPDRAVKANNMPAALYLSSTMKSASPVTYTATIKVLSGQAEQAQYIITATSGKVYIGRDKNVQTSDGFFRENIIAFPSDAGNESNRFISRQHAHIEWDSEAECFLLFADEGGIPPRNKVKVKTAQGGVIKLQAIEIGHKLETGDQILLGDKAALEFSDMAEDQS